MKTKKLISFLSALVLLLTLVVIPVSAAGATISIGNANVGVGGKVTVEVIGTGSISNFGFEIDYDSNYFTFVENSFKANAEIAKNSVELNTATPGYVYIEKSSTETSIYNSSVIGSFELQAVSSIDGVSQDVTLSIAAKIYDYGAFTEPYIYDDNSDAILDAVFNAGTITIRKAHEAPSITDLTITGDAKVGSTLTAEYLFVDNYDADDASTYVWYADGVVIEGAAAKEYEVKPADFGKIIKVKVTPTVEATEAITDNLTGEAVTSDETVAVTIDPAVKVAIAKDILTNVEISGAKAYLKAGKEYEVTYTNSVPAIDYSSNLKLRAYLLTNETDAYNETNLVTEDSATVTVTGLKVKVDKAEANKFLKVVLVANDGDATADVIGLAPILIKVVKSSSGSAGSTGPSLANKDKDEDVKDDDDKDVVDVDDKEDGTGTGTGLKFTDVPKEVYGWAIDAIKNLTEDGIIKGKSETAFDPSGEVTRAEFVAFLVRGLDFEEADTTEFTDVAEDFWGIKEIATAEKAGIFDYIEGDTFAPEEVLTRDEMALIAYNVTKAADIKLPELQGSVKFDDADAINPNAVEAVDALSKAGIILGNGDGTFAPKGTTIRAAAAKVVNLILVLNK